MKGTVDYLNETTRAGRYYLVELIRLDGSGPTAYAAQVVQKPASRSSCGGAAAPHPSEDDFLSRISDPARRPAESDAVERRVQLSAPAG
jgi:hypothetical protein